MEMGFLLEKFRLQLSSEQLGKCPAVITRDITLWWGQPVPEGMPSPVQDPLA